MSNIKKILIPIAILFGVLILSFFIYLSFIFFGNYAIDEEKLVLNSASKVVSLDDTLITKLYVENREIVPFSKIPEHVRHAFLSIEDRRFYDHGGIDGKAIARAIVADIRHGGKVQGGSTITQQLAKNLFLSNEKTMWRKVKEVLIALNLERRYSKDQILALYLNQIYFGHGAYGIEAASQLYFSKSVSELTVEEGASLAAIPKAPSHYSPLLQPEKNVERRNTVLYSMSEEGFLTETEYATAKNKKLKTNVPESLKNDALTSYIDLIYAEAESEFGIPGEELLRGGYTIVTPLDTKLQEIVHKNINDATLYPSAHPDIQSQGVFIDGKTGGVKAAVGGREYMAKGLNRVVVKRQPGSTIKPLYVFGPGMNEGIVGPYSLLPNERTDFNGYSPRNAGGVYTPTATVFDAITYSYNVPAVALLDEVGIDVAKDYAEKVGLSFEDDGLATALGGLSEGITPLALAGGYQSFLNEGVYIAPHFISRIYRSDGTEVERDRTLTESVWKPQVAWDMIRMLEQVVASGTGTSGGYEGALAGKTGTTSMPNFPANSRDAWFVGMTTDIVGAVWMGYDQNNGNEGIQSGSDTPVKLFKKVMSEYPNAGEATFTKPGNIEDLERPISLPIIEDVKAVKSGLFSHSITFTASSDERVVYRLYRLKDGKRKLVDEVIGVNVIDIPFMDALTKATYEVVPYDRITGLEGTPSNGVFY
ncbi:MAG: transglycosylase domain-containing protein [Bacilli bacterium]